MTVNEYLAQRIKFKFSFSFSGILLLALFSSRKSFLKVIYKSYFKSFFFFNLISTSLQRIGFHQVLFSACPLFLVPSPLQLTLHFHITCDLLTFPSSSAVTSPFVVSYLKFEIVQLEATPIKCHQHSLNPRRTRTATKDTKADREWSGPKPTQRTIGHQGMPTVGRRSPPGRSIQLLIQYQRISPENTYTSNSIQTGQVISRDIYVYT